METIKQHGCTQPLWSRLPRAGRAEGFLGVAACLLAIFYFVPYLQADITIIPEYKLGDVAVGDITTPVELVVVNAEETKLRREKAAARVPAIYRFDGSLADESERRLRKNLAQAREDFLDRIEIAFQKRELGPQGLLQPKFGRAMQSFQKAHRSFPAATNLFELWATGGSDELIEAEWVTKVRRIMRQYLRENSWPAGVRSSPGQVQMLFTGFGTNPGPDELNPKNVLVARSNIFGIGKAKTEFQLTFPGEEQGVAKFLSGFIQVNCRYDESLTREVRRRKVETIFATDHYQSGDSVVKKGVSIDAKIMAALVELRLKTAAEVVRAEAKRDSLKSRAALALMEDKATLAQLEVQTASQRNLWLVVGLAATSLLSLAAVLMVNRHRKRPSMLPALIAAPDSGALVACPSCNEPIALPVSTTALASVGPSAAQVMTEPGGRIDDAGSHDWRDRALRAEERAEKATSVLRAGLIPQLARWMMGKLVRGLVADRQQLLVTQKAASEEVIELGERLAAVQAPLQERLAAYERRIGELEKQLAAKGEENRELIKAKIALARRQLELERSKGEVVLN